MGIVCWIIIGLSLLLVGCQPVTPTPLKLTLWHGVNPPPNRVVLQKLIDDYNHQHPQAPVEAVYVGQADEQLPKILAAVVGDAPPDLLWFSPTLTGQLVELGALRSLEDWWQDSPRRLETDPALITELAGHLWSVPFDTNNVGIFYRPSLFEAAGITQLPRTWTELRQVARQLTQDKDQDGTIDQYGFLLPLGQGEWTVFTWLPFLWSAGGTLLNAHQQPALVNKGAITALQFWQTLVQDGSGLLSAPERGYELDAFLAGRVAMQLSGPWTLGQLLATGVDFAVLPIPGLKTQVSVLGGENLFIFKTTPEREAAAWEFAQFILSCDFQSAWAEQTGYLPVNLRARQSPGYRQFVRSQPALRVFLDQKAQARPIIAGYSRLSDNLGRAIEAVLLSQSSPDQALQAAQERLDLILGN